jgi:hypothetical protein
MELFKPFTTTLAPDEPLRKMRAERPATSILTLIQVSGCMSA